MTRTWRSQRSLVVATAICWWLIVMNAALCTCEDIEVLYALKPTPLRRIDVASSPLMFKTSLASTFDTIRLMVACDNVESDFFVSVTSSSTYWKNQISFHGAQFTSRFITDLPAPDDYTIKIEWTGTNGTESKVGTIDVAVMLDKVASSAKDPLPNHDGVLVGAEGSVIAGESAYSPRINSTTNTITLAWWPATDADTYIVFALPHPCMLDMQMMVPASLLTNGTQIWQETSSEAPTSLLVREIPWPSTLKLGATYCLNVVAYRGTSTSAAAAYCPVTVMDPTWRGPSAGLWAAIGVVIGFIVITIIGVFVYLHVKSRQNDSFERNRMATTNCQYSRLSHRDEMRHRLVLLLLNESTEAAPIGQLFIRVLRVRGRNINISRSSGAEVYLSCSLSPEGSAPAQKLRSSPSTWGDDGAWWCDDWILSIYPGQMDSHVLIKLKTKRRLKGVMLANSSLEIPWLTSAPNAEVAVRSASPCAKQSSSAAEQSSFFREWLPLQPLSSSASAADGGMGGAHQQDHSTIGEIDMIVRFTRWTTTPSTMDPEALPPTPLPSSRTGAREAHVSSIKSNSKRRMSLGADLSDGGATDPSSGSSGSSRKRGAGVPERRNSTSLQSQSQSQAQPQQAVQSQAPTPVCKHIELPRAIVLLARDSYFPGETIRGSAIFFRRKTKSVKPGAHAYMIVAGAQLTTGTPGSDNDPGVLTFPLATIPLPLSFEDARRGGPRDNNDDASSLSSRAEEGFEDDHIKGKQEKTKATAKLRIEPGCYVWDFAVQLPHEMLPTCRTLESTTVYQISVLGPGHRSAATLFATSTASSARTTASMGGGDSVPSPALSLASIRPQLFECVAPFSVFPPPLPPPIGNDTSLEHAFRVAFASRDSVGKKGFRRPPPSVLATAQNAPHGSVDITASLSDRAIDMNSERAEELTVRIRNSAKAADRAIIGMQVHLVLIMSYKLRRGTGHYNSTSRYVVLNRVVSAENEPLAFPIQQNTERQFVFTLPHAEIMQMCATKHVGAYDILTRSLMLHRPLLEPVLTSPSGPLATVTAELRVMAFADISGEIYITAFPVTLLPRYPPSLHNVLAVSPPPLPPRAQAASTTGSPNPTATVRTNSESCLIPAPLRHSSDKGRYWMLRYAECLPIRPGARSSSASSATPSSPSASTPKRRQNRVPRTPSQSTASSWFSDPDPPVSPTRTATAAAAPPPTTLGDHIVTSPSNPFAAGTTVQRAPSTTPSKSSRGTAASPLRRSSSTAASPAWWIDSTDDGDSNDLPLQEGANVDNSIFAAEMNGGGSTRSPKKGTDNKKRGEQKRRRTFVWHDSADAASSSSSTTTQKQSPPLPQPQQQQSVQNGWFSDFLQTPAADEASAPEESWLPPVPSPPSPLLSIPGSSTATTPDTSSWLMDFAPPAQEPTTTTTAAASSSTLAGISSFTDQQFVAGGAGDIDFWWNGGRSSLATTSATSGTRTGRTDGSRKRVDLHDKDKDDGESPTSSGQVSDDSESESERTASSSVEEVSSDDEASVSTSTDGGSGEFLARKAVPAGASSSSGVPLWFDDASGASGSVPPRQAAPQTAPRTLVSSNPFLM